MATNTFRPLWATTETKVRKTREDNNPRVIEHVEKGAINPSTDNRKVIKLLVINYMTQHIKTDVSKTGCSNFKPMLYYNSL